MRIVTCTNKRNCDFARAHLHDVMICDESSREPRGTTSNKRSVGKTQLKLDNTQQNTDRRGTSATPLQVQQGADKDKMVVDPLSHNAGGKVPISAIGLQSTVTGSGKNAAPTAETLEQTTMGNTAVVAFCASPDIEQSPNGKKAAQGQSGHGGSSSQSQRQAQIHKKQKRLTDGFILQISNHPHVGKPGV